MAAYAALLALARSLQQILDLEQYVDPLHKEKIFSLHEKVDLIAIFLEDYSDKHHGKLDCVGNGIRKAAFEAQDFVDSYLFWVSTTDHEDGSSSSEVKNLDGDLTMASERIDFVWEETMKMNNSDTTTQDILPSEYYSFPVNDRSSTAKNLVVGFDDDLNAIKERLYDYEAKLQIIPIFGMGGMGKTTLARKAYEDSILSQYFDMYAWITVSQEYRKREILSGILKSLKIYKEQYSDKSEAQLATLVYQNLIGRRYLIVIDDIWSTKAWDDLKMLFPDDGNGSRILLTSRILEVAAHAGSSDTLVHRMSFLNEDQSWKLLRQRVFGQKYSCPPQLVEVGKKIAKNCGGLPLTIVVVAGLVLSSGNVMSEQVWGNISENISSREPTIALQCSKILCFSYDRLPLRLKPCFLYIAAFPEDSDIDVSKLIRLWVAEGFLKPNDKFKCLEDVGEGYLEDLVKRSLVLVSKKGPDGKLETVGIHDMLREICITKAEEEWFFHHHVCSKKYSSHKEFIENPYRRLKIHIVDRCFELNINDSSVRSILFDESLISFPSLHVRSRHVCILDAPHAYSKNISYVFSTFVNLRLSNLRNLEELQIRMYYYFSTDYSMTWKHVFPMGLKKLYLESVPFPWENMNIIGSLPELQVLHMTAIRVNKASEWRTEEGQFLQLKYFHSSLNYVVKWEMEKEHFPCLESLILDGAIWIYKFPSGVEEIDSLQYIELRNCNKSLVESAKKIQRQQHEIGTDAFRVRVIDYKGKDVLF
ncbi:putative late blight resistance protein homolog R1A-10 isoform X1 [Henckelia pumila]|uniref:putative late blight resistance protein homolog R1A-10 isoform X1 n=1 Tax=Henckelia pumila TaxID=405737 RepID=UPI003C6DD50F